MATSPSTYAREVLGGLRSWAITPATAMRSAELARRLGLGRGHVTEALVWLTAQPRSGVVRQRTRAELWDKYWIESPA
jgi:hypothetical protein